MTKREKAAALNQRALKFQERGKCDEAIKLYQQALALQPRSPVTLYNLGLLFKKEQNWKESLRYNRLATAAEPANQAAWWNFGIAATALGRWNLARSAWHGFGIALPDGEGPIDLPCGYGPIRLNPDGEAEVVWAYRIDPARALLVSIPFPESGHRWHDIVLNDGAPCGYRQCDGKEVPVLNALARLEPSPFATFVARVQMPDREDYLAKLTETATELAGSAEDWSTSIRMICRACSEGRPHQAHDAEAVRPEEDAHLIGIAARDRQHANSILSAWAAGAAGIQIESLDDALEQGTPER